MGVLRPDVYLRSVCDLDPEQDLVNRGIKGRLLDMDNTLRPRDTAVVPPSVRAWLDRVQAAGIRCCILSNSFKESTAQDGAELGIPVVMKALKPLPFAYPKALRLLGCGPKETMAVGDQLSTDVWGANLCGIISVLVEPQCSLDLGHTAQIRKIERMILGSLVPRESPSAPRE